MTYNLASPIVPFLSVGRYKVQIVSFRNFEYLSTCMYIEVVVLFSAKNCVFYVHSERKRILKTNECWGL
jgi:hypothetical protein